MARMTFEQLVEEIDQDRNEFPSWSVKALVLYKLNVYKIQATDKLVTELVKTIEAKPLPLFAS